MPPHDTIEGAKLRQMIRRLVADKILIKLSVPRSMYEHLTIITDLNDGRSPRFFRIDAPLGANVTIQTHHIRVLDFEFTGWDQVIHVFKAEVHRVDAEDIWLRYPEVIQRLQQRQNFRIEPGSNSLLRLTHGESTHDLTINNISSGGALCTCPKTYKTLIEPDQQWSNVFLELGIGKDAYHMIVDQLRILRLSPDAIPGQIKVAMEFCQINPQNHRKLLQYINACQRKTLQERHQASQ